MTVVSYITLFCDTCHVTLKGTMTLLALSMMMITKILNPWIYVLKNKDFKNAVKGHCKRAQVAPETDVYLTNLA